MRIIVFIDLILSMIDFIYALTASNLLLAALAVYFWRKSKIKRDRPTSVEAEEMLLDLLSGGSLIRVSRIAPADALIHTRHKR